MDTIRRLTQAFIDKNIEHFKRCQLCGFTSNDICEFRMYLECDDEDKREPGNILILCQKEACKKVLK